MRTAVGAPAAEPFEELFAFIDQMTVQDLARLYASFGWKFLAPRKLCVRCLTPVESYEGVGRCVYADPCGHRQWQGRVPDAS